MGIFNHEKKEKINYLNGLISIIVPIYNAKDTLERCLKSLISQSYKNIEIICIDDASTDASSLLLEAFATKDKRIKIIKNKENKGIAYSRNIGLKAAIGEYIMWCDSDDWYEKNMVQDMVQSLIDNDVDLVVCNQKIVNSKHLETRDVFENVKHIYDFSFIGYFPLFSEIIFNSSWVLWNKIFKKSVIDKYKIKFSDVRIGEDYNFFLKYISVMRPYIYFLNKKLYNYFRRNDSLIGNRFNTDSDNPGFTDCIKAFDDILSFLKKNRIKRFRKDFEACYYLEVNYILNLMSKSLKIKTDNLFKIVK